MARVGMRLQIAGVAAALVVACGRPAPTCPSPDALEAMHAAAFYLDHGQAESGRERLARARSLAPRPADATTDRVLRGLARAAGARVESERRTEAELVRVELQDWACLTPELHARFHAALPPID